MAEFSAQEKFVLDRLLLTYNSIAEANKLIADRATIILGGGTAIATAFGSFRAISISDAYSLPLGLLVAAAACSLFSLYAAGAIFSPLDTGFPGSTELADLRDRFLHTEASDAVENGIQDLVCGIEAESRCNDLRARWFRLLLVGVWLQVTLVFFAVCLA